MFDFDRLNQNQRQKDIMNILAITGASGYLGQGLIAKLMREKNFDRIIGIDVRRPADTGFPFVNMDVRNAMLGDLFRRESVTHVVHLAYVVNPTHHPRTEYDIDVNGTRNLLNACSSAGVKKLVVSSSIGAYGWHEDNPVPIPESFPLRGNDDFPYARNKKTVEEIIGGWAQEHPDCSVVVLRICNVLGPHVHNAISAGLEAPLILGVAGFDPWLAFTHEEDMNEILYEALFKPVRGAFNVAGDGMLKLSEVAGLARKTLIHLPAAAVRSLLNALFFIRILPFGGGQMGFVHHSCVPDISKLKNEFGYTPRFSSGDTFRQFVEERLR